MERLQLRAYDGLAITGFLILPALFGTGLSKLVEQHNAAAWMALLLAFAVMACLFLLSSRLMKRYEGQHIIDITTKVMGKPLGILYGVMLSAYFCYYTGIGIRETAEIIKIYGLRLTPMVVVAGLLLLVAVLMNMMGGRAIVKSAGIFFVVMAAGVLFAMLLGLNRYHPDNLVPLLGNGLPDIAAKGLLTTSLFDAVMVLFLFAPAFSSTAVLKKSGMLSLAVSVGAFMLLSVCFVMMFSPDVGAKMMSGMIEMGKSSYYNHFFYRFESVLLLLLIISAAIQLSIGLLVAKESLVATFRLKGQGIATLICTALVAILLWLPENILDLSQQYLPAVRQYSVFFMAGFPLLVLIISTIKRGLGYEKV